MGSEAATWAEQQVAAVRHDPTGRTTLMERCYNGPFGKAPRHLPFRRAAMSFMGWQLRRGVLQPPSSERPGSPWWRAVGLLDCIRDGALTYAWSLDDRDVWRPPPSSLLRLVRRALPPERPARGRTFSF